MALQVGVPRGRLFPSGHCLSAAMEVVWAWPDPLPTRLKRVGKNSATEPFTKAVIRVVRWFLPFA